MFEFLTNLGKSKPDPKLPATPPKSGASNPRKPEPPTTQTAFFDKEGFQNVIYNGLTHKVQIFLSNSGDFVFNAKNQYRINPNAILQMVIDDTLNDWVVSGYITLLYIPEKDADPSPGGQPGKTNTVGQAATENGEMLSHYEFRNDGFDLLRVIIASESTAVDKTGNEKDATPSLPNEDINLSLKPDWTLSYMFSIYEVEDVNDIPNMDMNVSTYMKCLKLYFRDVRYHLLNTTNLEYSTATSKNYNPDFTGENLDNEGYLFTGEALSDVLKETFNIYDKEGVFKHEPKFVLESADPNASIKTYNWDKGGGHIFYTSPADCTAYEDMQYIYAHHVSEKFIGEPNDFINDLCLLSTRKSPVVPNLQEISLLPISKYFQKSTEGDKPGELQLEHFFVTTQTKEERRDDKVRDVTIDKVMRAPILSPSDPSERDLKTFKYGQITSFSFVDMSALTNSEFFRSRPVYSVDFRKRTLSVDFEKNTISKARQIIGKEWIKHLYKKENDTTEEQLFLPVIHENKADPINYNVFPAFTLNGDNAVAAQVTGLHQLLYCGLFHNACISFTTFGLTIREPGSFIAIDRSDGEANNDYNNKLYGQWFVIKVEHTFEAGIYYNKIYAVKVHRFRKRETLFEHIV